MESAPNKDYDAIERAFLAYKGRKQMAFNPGTEWFTAAQFATRMGKSRRTAREALQRMVEEGVLEFADYKVNVNERINLVRHYKLV